MIATLETRISLLRRRVMAVAAVGAGGWALAAATASLIAGMWSDLAADLSSVIRLSWLLICIVGGAALGAFLIWKARRSASPHRLAVRLDRAGNTAGQILSGVELERSGAIVAQTLTARLAAFAVERASTLAAAIDITEAAPLGPLRRPLLSAGGVALFCVMAAVTAPRMAQTELFRFFTPFADIPPYSRIELEVSPGAARVVYGASLEVRVSVRGGDVDRLDVILAPENGQTLDRVPLFMESAGQWRTTVSNITSPGQYFVQGRGVRSKRFAIDVITVPSIKAVRFHISPPAYTHLGAYDGPLPPGGVAGLPGTLVEIYVASNRPLSGGSIEFAPPTAGPATRPSVTYSMSTASAAGAEVSGRFTIESAGKFTLHIFDTSNQPSTDVFSAPVALLNDDQPFIRLLQPKATSFATASSILPVDLAAEDDYGVARVQLFRSLNDSRAVPLEMEVPSAQPTRLSLSASLPLADYGLSAGDTIKLYARVEDNDPRGSKGSESPVASVRIISEEEYRQMVLAKQGMEVLQSKYEQAQRQLEGIRQQMAEVQKKLDAAPPESPIAQELRDELAALADKLAKASQEIRKSSETLLPFDIDKALAGELARLADEMADAASAINDMTGMTGQKASQAMQQLQNLLKQQQDDFQQKALLPMELLAKAFALLQDEARFIQIYEHQRSLEQRLASLKETDRPDDPRLKARMRDLEGEQRQLRDQFRTLLDDIEKHAQELPDDPAIADLRQGAMEIARQLRASGAQEEMANAEAGLGDFSGPRGYAGARNAADILDRFISRSEGFGDEVADALGLHPQLGKILGNTLGQLLAASGLHSKTGQAGAGGYSMNQNSLNNVGVYGSLPTPASAARSGNDAANGGKAAGDAITAQANDTGRAAPHTTADAAGQGAIQVPPRYQRRVGDYFQRVADELNEK